MKKDPFKYFHSSPEIIRLAVMMYVRFPLSLRNVEDLLHERGIDISHETVRVNGTAELVRDLPLRESMAINGRVPELAVLVRVEEAFYHCGKVRAAHPMFTAKPRNRHTALRLLQNTHNLRVAISCCLHQKSPQLTCRENSTYEHR